MVILDPKMLFTPKMIFLCQKWFFYAKIDFFRPKNVFYAKNVFFAQKYFTSKYEPVGPNSQNVLFSKLSFSESHFSVLAHPWFYAFEWLFTIIIYFFFKIFFIKYDSEMWNGTFFLFFFIYFLPVIKKIFGNNNRVHYQRHSDKMPLPVIINM